MEAGRRYERPGAAANYRGFGWARKRISSRRRIRYRGRLRDHGDLLSRHLDQGFEGPAGKDRGWIYARPKAYSRGRFESAWRHGGAFEKPPQAESRANARKQPRLHSWRAFRQYRAWLQFRARHQDRAEI